MPFQPTNTDSDKLRYLLTVLKHTETFKPNWAGVAEEVGLSRSDKARDKLKAQLPNNGFVLLKEGRVAEVGNEEMPVSPTKATPKKRTPAKKQVVVGSASKTSVIKKRKAEAMEDVESGDGVVEGEGGGGVAKEAEA